MKPVKAYRNTEFLNSPIGRSIRILSEFLEPLGRFKKEGVKNTIVVFGSARVLPRTLARKRLDLLKAKYRSRKIGPGNVPEDLEKAKIALGMSAYYEDAVKLTYLLTRWSKSLNKDAQFAICSGGGPGIMEAANKGAIKAGGRSIGLNISLPFEQDANPYVSKELGFEFHYFFMRKFWFLYPAKGLLMFPGGFGTLDELMEVLTLVQTKKITNPLPIILYGRKYWNSIMNFDEMVRLGVITKADTKLFSFADTPEEAFSLMKGQLQKLYARRYHTGIFHG
ncbi:MAG TPA: LOG family protein [Bacteroidota bacterium]|nr:LOG family protein [Bacteroidota bacterium]